jgi:hypothetical protein
MHEIITPFFPFTHVTRNTAAMPGATLPGGALELSFFIRVFKVLYKKERKKRKKKGGL